ncbi:sensor histidine kinase [Phenylobacterium sp.]|uniref:sensor histidine kinase n=1 Tax=Phenylobacterium sp. TaxID=1871053 RepID=UPI002C5C916A|nr:sensor histidine kinase [Phenylobacterium sp.]HLZ77145.1 sensor histidine kinase [Phenylobacterium sp.]
MSEDDAPQLRFRPRARIIRTIGDQLISGPEAAVIELVKNAYDADASEVSVKFFPPLTVGAGRIVITDDGHGMTLSDIEEKWMEPATAAKVVGRRSPKKDRVMMGSKGIGRFAAAKLGGKMGLSSVSGDVAPRDEVLIPEIDWSIFSSEAYLDKVAIDFFKQKTEVASGTEIEVRELNEPWPEAKLRKLHVELRRLIPPLKSGDEDSGFRIYLDLSELTRETAGFDGATIGQVADADDVVTDPRASYRVRPLPLLTNCDYEVEGAFDDEGRFIGTMEIRRGGQAPASIDVAVPPKEKAEERAAEDCGPVGVHLYIFDREVETLRSNFARAGAGAVTASEARQMLDDIAGIAIYRDGFRIRPYGDPTNDWLTLDSRRVQTPSLRIGHNQIAGYITLESDSVTRLVERSSREGFEENAAFERLKRLVTTLLAEVVEPRRQTFRDKAGISRRRTTTFDEVRELSQLKKLQSLVNDLPEEKRAAAAMMIARESDELSKKIEALQERQRILEANSSLGAIIGEVLHEGATPAHYIHTTSQRLQTLYPFVRQEGERGDTARADFPKKLHIMETNGGKLVDLFSSLRPLAGGKRGKAVRFRPADVISKAADLFSVRDAVITIHDGFNAPAVLGYPGDLSTAVVNLFNNSIYWLGQAQTEDPRIDVWFEAHGEVLSIFVDDNGPGIRKEFGEQIFDVGFTLKDGGTGLGLNIALEALHRSGATLLSHLDHRPGARFEIRFKL